MASSAAAASAGSSMIAKYISKVRAGLRRQRPEAREAWLEASMIEETPSKKFAPAFLDQ